jgi:dimethylargininase
VLTAITRKVSPNLAACQLEYLRREPIDVARAEAQHRDYEAALARLGARVVSLPAEPDLPDCVFVEDPALVLDEIAIITRMGTESRRGESESLAAALARFRPLARMHEPATLEGGDVVRMGKTLYVGLSRRSNAEGARQLAEIVEPHGYHVVAIAVTGCLHLKSACCAVSDDTVLANRALFDASALHCKVIDAPAEEPGAADVLCIGGAVLMPASFPRTARLLEQSGIAVQPLDVSELQKAEAGVTCMSLVFEVTEPAPPAAPSARERIPASR